MPVQTTKQNVMSFAGGVDASTPAHALPQDIVQTATNLDFSIERGAARARRGYDQYVSTPNISHYALFKSWMPHEVNNSWLYTGFVGTGGTAGVGRVTISADTPGTYTVLVSNGDGSNAEFAKYRQYTYLAAGTALYKDDGTNTTEWIKQVPPKPTVTLNTATNYNIITGSSTLTILEGTNTLGTNGTNTCTANSLGRSTMLLKSTINLGTGADGAVIGTNGIVYTQVGFSDPTNIYRISVDFATDTVTLGTTTATQTVTNGTTTTTINPVTIAITTGFQNFWHGEYLPNIGRSIIPSYPSADTTTGAAQQNGLGTAISNAQVSQVQSLINADQQLTQLNITFSGNTPSSVAIPIANFNFVGTWTASGTHTDAWQGLTAVRVTVESYVPTQTTLLCGLYEQGDANYCLTDMNVGYTYYQTWAELDANGNFLGESAASPSAGPFKCVNANFTVVCTGTTTGSQAGITNIITYRQGGYCQTPYAVGTTSYGTMTLTDTTGDIQALLDDIPMVINVRGRNYPGGFGYWNIMANEAFYDRIYLANTNTLMWSEIGRPDQFIITNTALVTTDPGDAIAGLVVWPPGLIIINWRSVYEMTGTVFEGPTADFVIQKAAPKRGSVAPGTIIKTPHGIPLVNYDGITMYIPGSGVDVPIPWINAQIGDAWRGFGTFDPAALAGNRVPAINGHLFQAFACYAEGKLYLTVATGNSSTPNTVFVMDFYTEKCWWYQYQTPTFGSQPINSLLWDFENNNIFAGGTDGLYQIETEITEGTAGNYPPWSFQTKEWSVANDTLVENFAIEYVGGPFQVTAVYDGTATITIGTCSSQNKTWNHFPLNGLVNNSLSFQLQQLTGTATGTFSSYGAHTAVYNITWDSIEQPQKVHFFQTDYDDNHYPGDKLWDVEFHDVGFLQANEAVNQATGTATITTTTTGTATTTVIGTETISATGTVTAVTFIDGVAVMTNTMIGTGTPSAGRNIFTFSFPAETYGEIAYTTYTTSQPTGTATASTMGLFKLWDHRYQARNEPPKTTVWRTTIESLDEAICDAFDSDINPNGTVLATAFVDNTPLMTATITSTAPGEQYNRQSYTNKLPVEVYGRTLYVLYNGSGGNWFKHYNTMFHRRPEPDRWTNYVSDRRSTQEQHFDAHEVDVNPLGNTVLGTALIDGIAYGTFTYTGTLRERFVNAFPANTYGKTTWTQFSVSTATDTNLNPRGGRFKYFSDHFIGTLEPDRLTFVQKIFPPFPSEHYIKTWIAELNPLGVCTGTLMADGIAITTNTFAGTIRETYNVGLELLTGAAQALIGTATAIEIRYTGSGSPGLFKHYRSDVESDPKPFGKLTWGRQYEKSGGISQIDMARFWAVDVELPPGNTVTLMTSIWDIDGLPGFSTNTMTLTGSGRVYIDRVPFPPGGRGRLFQQKITFSSPAKVWRSTLDEEQIGAKGVTRKTLEATPIESYYAKSQFSNNV
jgi:hypothetical protein